MRRIVSLVLLPLIGCLFTAGPVEADSIPFQPSFSDTIHFRIADNDLGTMSYAGGSAPLMGSNIAVFDIVQGSVDAPGDPALKCVECILNFSTGPFAGTTPGGIGDLPDYAFSGGGSFQIIGGVTPSFLPVGAPNTTLPIGTTLLTGVMTGMLGVSDDICGLGPCSEVGFAFAQGTVHPAIGFLYGLPAGVSSVSGGGLIATLGVNNAPDPFIQSTFGSTHRFEPSFIQVSGFTVPVPATFWPFAVGFMTLAAWWARRMAIPQ